MFSFPYCRLKSLVWQLRDLVSLLVVLDVSFVAEDSTIFTNFIFFFFLKIISVKKLFRIENNVCSSSFNCLFKIVRFIKDLLIFTLPIIFFFCRDLLIIVEHKTNAFVIPDFFASHRLTCPPKYRAKRANAMLLRRPWTEVRRVCHCSIFHTA